MLKRKLVNIFLVIAMVVSMPMVASAEQWKNISWLFDLKTGVLTLTGTGKDSPTGTAPWKSFSNSVIEVQVEEGISSVESYYFKDFGSLEKVSLPNSLRKIGGNTSNSGAFANCISLREIKLPDNLTEIGGGAFYNTSLTTITIPSKVAKIDGEAFGGCSKLTSVIFLGDAPEFSYTYPLGSPNNRSYAFDNNEKLTIYYPSEASGWDIMSLPFGGKINWVAYNPANGLPDVNSSTNQTTPQPTQLPIIENSGQVSTNNGIFTVRYVNADTLEPIIGLYNGVNIEYSFFDVPNQKWVSGSGVPPVLINIGDIHLQSKSFDINKSEFHIDYDFNTPVNVQTFFPQLPTGWELVGFNAYASSEFKDRYNDGVYALRAEIDGYLSFVGTISQYGIDVLVRKVGEQNPNSDTSSSAFQGEAISAGAKFNWESVSNSIGYRIYRSENAYDEGISITDFYITDNQFIDVNVQPNKTYYYTICAVIAEARPFDGIQEQLGTPSAKITINTPDKILGDDLVPPIPNAVKKFILMTIDDPYMTVGGERQEIDPGRGTTPMLLNNRTMVPIRAIVEGMGGNVAWNDSTREITMNYQQNAVKMTLDISDFTVNGTAKIADVPPTAINGRTLVPVRFVAESLGCAIDWLNSTRQVVIVYY